MKVRFILKNTGKPLGKELLPPPDGSQFELDLQALPKVGDVLHVHTDLLPPYFTRGGVEPYDIKIDRGENSGDYKDTVKITIEGQPWEPRDSVVHIVRPTAQVAVVLYRVELYPMNSWRDMKP